jgi:hypothetical protein
MGRSAWQRRAIKVLYVGLIPLDGGVFPVYLHAYDYCPEDPMVCLCPVIASLGRAMQRQADDRQHLMAQVRLARFLSRSGPSED